MTNKRESLEIQLAEHPEWFSETFETMINAIGLMPKIHGKKQVTETVRVWRSYFAEVMAKYYVTMHLLDHGCEDVPGSLERVMAVVTEDIKEHIGQLIEDDQGPFSASSLKLRNPFEIKDPNATVRDEILSEQSPPPKRTET